MSRLGSRIPGALLLLTTVAFALPLSAGLWDPAALRVADEPVGRDLTDKSMETGEATAPFSAEQRDFQGRLLWKLEGERLEGVGGSLLHVVSSPRLLLRQDGLSIALSAKKAEVHLPKESDAATSSVVRLELTGEVSADLSADPKGEGPRPSASLRTEALTLWIDRDSERRQEPGGVRLGGSGPVRVHAEGIEGGPWDLTAASLEGTIVPPRITLGGPVQFGSGPLADLGNAPVRGVAKDGVVLSGSSQDGGAAPAILRITCLGVDARTEGDDPSTLTATRLSVNLRRATTGEADPLGSYTVNELVGSGVSAKAGLATAAQGAWLEAAALSVQREGTPATTAVEAHGDVKFGRVGATPTEAWQGRAKALAATFEAGAPQGLAGLQRLHIEGGAEGANLSQAKGSRIRLQALDYEASGEVGDLRMQRLQARLEGVERGRHAAPWDLSANTASARVTRSALAASADFDWRALLRRADLAGGVRVQRRSTDPQRQRGVRGERVTWSEDGQVRVTTGEGRGPVEVELGRSALKARVVEYTPDSGHLEASGGLTFVSALPAKAGAPEQPLEIVAERGWATLSSDPEAWRRHQNARRAAKREAKKRGEPKRQLLPAPLDALTLVGGRRRVRVRGPGGLRAEADQVTYTRTGGELILSAQTAGAPVRAESEKGHMTCRRLRLLRFAPAGPLGPRSLWISANGEVSARGRLTSSRGTTTQIGIDCAWLACELAEGDGPPASLLRRALAGGEQGVRVLVLPAEGASAPAERVALVARSLEIEGDRPLSGGGRGLWLLLPGDWRGELKLPRRGPARVQGGRLEALLDVEALTKAGDPNEPEEARFRRLIDSLSASEGIELVAKGLRVKAKRAHLDGGRGAYVIEGDPAVVTRDGLSQEAQLQILELSGE